jgi:integrase/recombinase XerD
MPVTGAESWTVVGDDGAVVAPAERYLAYLSALERSPNTVRAYAVSLRLWFEFLGRAGVGWAEAGPEDVARFVAWLRAPAENVIVLETGAGRRSAATVNRHLAAVFGFYGHHARAGVGVATGGGRRGAAAGPARTGPLGRRTTASVSSPGVGAR